MYPVGCYYCYDLVVLRKMIVVAYKICAMQYLLILCYVLPYYHSVCAFLYIFLIHYELLKHT